MIDTAALDRYTFIRRSYLQRRHYLSTMASLRRTRRKNGEITLFAACAASSPLAALRSHRLALAQEAPDAMVKRVAQETVAIDQVRSRRSRPATRRGSAR